MNQVLLSFEQLANCKLDNFVGFQSLQGLLFCSGPPHVSLALSEAFQDLITSSSRAITCVNDTLRFHIMIGFSLFSV